MRMSGARTCNVFGPPRAHALHNHPFATVAPHLHRAMRVLDTARLPDTFEPPPEEEGDDEDDEDGGAPVSSTQIFGLSALYTFPPREEWLAAEPGEPLANWLADGPPELPTPENLEARSEHSTLALHSMRSLG